MLVEELRLGPTGARTLRFALRYVAPLGIVAATLSTMLLGG